MRRRELTFRQATEKDVESILSFCRDKHCGTEIYASVKLNGEKTEIGSLWTGYDDEGQLRLVRYDNASPF